MEAELQALHKNNTWEITDLPQGMHTIGSKWIYKVKRNSDGTIQRYKAILVARGFTQTEGLDYHETCAPVVKMNTIRTLLAVAVSKGWPLFQLDVDNAFLHGQLDEEVYMTLPHGYFKTEKAQGKVCKLLKSLYGTSSDLIQKVKAFIHDLFKIKDLGQLRYFLGFEVSRSDDGLFLNQKKYALELISEAGLLGCKPSIIPMDTNHKLGLSTAPVLTDPMPYRRLVGQLIYLTYTRPDLAYHVHILSQFMNQPTEDHLKAAHKVLGYLKMAPAQGLFYPSGRDLRLSAFCDADWGACPLTRKSITGYAVTLGNALISWKTKKQATVSRSSAEAEYRSMAHTCCEIVWLVKILADFQVHIQSPVPLHCDNVAAMHIAKNPVFHERTKHVELDCHVVRQHFNSGLINPHFVSTSEQPADLLTKPLSSDRLMYLSTKLNVVNKLHTLGLKGVLRRSRSGDRPGELDSRPGG
ncbi:unnamed protein product [Rhodiola kirilowii]